MQPVLSEQIILRRQRLIKQLDQTTDMCAMEMVIGIDRLRREVIMRDVERGHDGDSFQTDDFSVVANFSHLAIKIGDRLKQAFTFLVGTCDTELSSHDGDIEADVGLAGHPSPESC